MLLLLFYFLSVLAFILVLISILIVIYFNRISLIFVWVKNTVRIFFLIKFLLNHFRYLSIICLLYRDDRKINITILSYIWS